VSLEAKEYTCKTSVLMDECEDVRGLGIMSANKNYDMGSFTFADPVYACRYYRENKNTPLMTR